MPYTWLTTFVDRTHVWFISVFSTRSWIWHKLGKYLLSERTNFWRKGKREFQALKTKEPALQCNWATGQRRICPATCWRSKEFFIPKEHWSQTIQSKVKSAFSCLLQVKHGCLSRAKGSRHFKQLLQTASGANSPQCSGLMGGTPVHHALEKLDLWSQEAILNFYPGLSA